MSKSHAVILIIICSFLMSFNGLSIRQIAVEDALLINVYRSFFLLLSLSIFILIKDRSLFMKKIYDVGWAGIIGGLALGLANICFLQALLNTTVANALFTVSAIPFFTAILGFLFLGEILNKTTVFFIFVAFIGVYIMYKDGIGVGLIYGNSMALLTALLFSSFAIIARRYRSIDMIPTLLVGGLISILIGLAFRYEELGISLNDLIFCFISGGILSGIANIGFVVAIRFLIAAEVTLYMFVEFALGPFWVWIFTNEATSLNTLIGGGIIMIAVASKSIVELVYVKKSESDSVKT